MGTLIVKCLPFYNVFFFFFKLIQVETKGENTGSAFCLVLCVWVYHLLPDTHGSPVMLLICTIKINSSLLCNVSV